MALLQIHLVIAHVMFLYDFKRAEGKEHLGGGQVGAASGRHRVGEYQLNAHISAACNGPVMAFRRRDV